MFRALVAALTLAGLITAAAVAPAHQSMTGAGARSTSAAGGGSVWSVIGSISAVSGDTNNVTTGTLDTTGANLIVAVVGYFPGGTFTPPIVDSKSNAYTAVTAQVDTGQVAAQLFYKISPIVGAGHTFGTSGGSGAFPAICVVALKDTGSTPVVDTSSGAIGSFATPIQPGSITPVVNNEMLVTGATAGVSGTLSIDSGFSIDQQKSFAAGANEACGISHFNQTIAAAINPSWSLTTTAHGAVSMVAFKP